MCTRSQKKALPHQPESAAGGEAAVSGPGSASVASASFPSIADSAVTAGSSCNHSQHLHLSRGWDSDWSLCSGLPQSVDPEKEKTRGIYHELEEKNVIQRS